ncbi:hypothetical protein [Aestuariivirga litoralis]|uniref:hypothetical protein n=1 Tax=Aestuariivirga litoralis TaxID=2650924 RepID=UPI0018C6DD54|nr:hypothetical protein [Aestuariivirga litoralis]MBG1231720.1 hypothetical protein [Aestuariivirga litoralis]
MMLTKIAFAVLALGAIALPHAAEAKSARCYINTHGYFGCSFRSLGADGSFLIRGGDVAGFSMIMMDSGFASGFERFGSRNVPLAGTFVRDGGDPACWNNPELGMKVCAW